MLGFMIQAISSRFFFSPEELKSVQIVLINVWIFTANKKQAAKVEAFYTQDFTVKIASKLYNDPSARMRKDGYLSISRN